mmetsp:Transcript_116329/g.329073  ORF Transcript_116329/g.329073 Transcript_116329/m.329073 type:complete len:606 (-) Transcript_116329:100-1917(-)
MGATLPRPVTPAVVRRFGGPLFRVGLAEMNGWRKNMEDAHVIFMKDTWGFFGVFDGHGGDQCPKFIAKRLTDELEHGQPATDAVVKELMLRLDREFLETKQPSGSTGTFALVNPPVEPDGQYFLRVGNIGDSRVLLGRPDGTMVEGDGTDGGLTTDHKPDHPAERERIERTGGHVEVIQGVARVNGDLAVSRSFGDAVYKQTGGPTQEDHPVSAGPELITLSCASTDFLVLVCDGISEGAFPNRDVIKLAAEELFASGDKIKPDPGKAAAAVVRKALSSGSYDNCSCMIVLLGGGDAAGPEVTLLPGPYDAPCDGGFKKAYEDIVQHAGLTLAQAVEMRYDAAKQELSEESVGQNDTSLKAEIASFGDGPPATLTLGSTERTAWFSEWISRHEVEYEPDPSTMTQEEALDLLQRRPDLMAMARAQGLVPDMQAQTVKVGSFREVRAAVRACPSLKWTAALRVACGKMGTVIAVDPGDDTVQVRIPEAGMVVWLPASVLTEVDDGNDAGDEGDNGRRVTVVPLEELRAAIDASSAVTWNDKFADACGQNGTVICDDTSDGTSKVRFLEPANFIAWFPTSVLIDVDNAALGDDHAAGEPDLKRQRAA